MGPGSCFCFDCDNRPDNSATRSEREPSGTGVLLTVLAGRPARAGSRVLLLLPLLLLNAVVVGVQNCTRLPCFSVDLTETALGCEGPQNQPIPHVSCTYITQMSYLLYEICMKNLRNRNAIPVCKQGLFCFPFFSHVFPETAKLLQLLDTCLPPYSESCGTDGTVTHSNFDHELHLCLRYAFVPFSVPLVAVAPASCPEHVSRDRIQVRDPRPHGLQ